MIDAGVFDHRSNPAWLFMDGVFTVVR